MRFFTSFFHTNKSKAGTQMAAVSKLFWVLLFSLGFWQQGWAQPAVMSINQDVSGTYANSTTTLIGGAFQFRIQENATGTSSGTRNWQFNSDAYFNQWGTLAAAGVQTLAAYNTIIAPNTSTASGNFAASVYNSNGKLPATLANNYYTYNIIKGSSYASQRMSVLQTSFNPVTISSVAQAAGTYGSRTVTITTSGTPDAAENIFVRYSTNSYTTSTIVQATGSGTTWTATIPWQSAAVSFYVYSSNRSKATIDADVTSFSTQEVHDLSTLNLNNNSGSNYSWTPVTGNIIVSSAGGTFATPVGYASFTLAAGAFAAINGAVAGTNAITILITADVANESGVTSLNASTNWTSIAVNPNGARTISGTGSAGAALINFNGADNVTFDGLATGGNSLTISNLLVSATSGTCTIQFLNGATSNTITNCTVLGSATMSVLTNGGTIYFALDGSTANGNDNNTISNCNIGPAGANLPSKAIYGNGSTTTTAIGNSGILINNNNIYDFFAASAVTCAGISTQGGCNTWSITNNRLYQTATRTWTTGSNHRVIDISNTTSTSGAQGFTITGNIIGYSSNTQTGTYALTGSTGSFVGINFSGITGGTVSNINSNTIAAVSLSGVTSSGFSTSSPFMAIQILNGLVNTNSNIIGSQTATGSLVFSTNNTSATDVYGIYNFSSDNWTSSSNQIGGISVTNAAASGTYIIYGLRANTLTSASWTASSNLIGGTIANSIQLNATGTSSQVMGVYTSNAALTLTSNTIRNLTTNIGTGTSTAASVIGVQTNTTSNNNTISQNTIYNLSNTNASAASVITGIQFTGSTANTVERNTIYGLSVSSNSATTEVNGIRVAGGTTLYKNNMIRLGTSISNAVPIYGINEPLGTDQFFHNSIYIGGTATSGTSNSFAFNSSQTVNTRSFRDNIFVNQRANSGASGKNYAVAVGGSGTNPTGLTINNNIYYANNSGGVFGLYNTADVANLSAWQTAIGQDAASFQSDPQFIAPTAATPDLHIHPTNPTNAESNGVDLGVTDDFDGQTRSGLTPVDIGADAGNFVVGGDITAPSISYTPFGTTLCITDQTLTATITDVSGINTTAGTRPRLYYKKSTNTNTFNDNTSGTDGWKYVEATGAGGSPFSFTTNYALINGGVAAGNTIQYFVVAQDLSSTPAPNVGINSGTFAATPSTVALTSAAFPLTGTINSYLIGTGGLSANVTIGASGTYPNLTSATGLFAALNASGLTANITATLLDASIAENGVTALNQVAYGCASNYTLTIKPNTGISTTLSGNVATGALIKLNGADYITFDGSNNGSSTQNLTITNTNTAGTGAVIWLSSVSSTNGATNNTIKNCIITGTTSTSLDCGIISSGSTYGGVAETQNANNTYTNNTINTMYTAIAVVGPSGNETGTVISNNLIGSATAANKMGASGIEIYQQQNVTVSGNTIFGITTSNGSIATTSGIAVWGTISGGNIYNNKISDIKHTSSAGWGSNGIQLTASTTASNLTIYNNFISDIASYGFAGTAFDDNGYGIVAETGGGYNIYFNSISLATDQTVATGTTMPINITSGITTAASINLKGNILSNTQTTSTRYAIYSGAANTVYSTIDYNDYYTSGTNLGFISSTRSNLAAWKTGTGKDVNSQSILPVFISATDLHMNLYSNNTLNNLGNPVSGITTDIDGTTRNVTTPDIGADEFTPPVNDAGITNITYPAVPLCSGAQTFVATIKNYGTATLTAVTFNWQLNGGSVTSTNLTGLSVATNGTTTTNFSVTLPVGVAANTVNGYTTLPNSTTDENSANDGFTANNIYVALNGAYTVGATGADFTTLNATSTTASAVYYANTYGICGPSSFNLTSTYVTANETVLPISISQLNGTSVANTLTIKPASGVTATISGSVASGAIIKLNGADNIIIDGSNNGTSSQNLTITNSNTTSPTAIWVGSTGTGSGATGNTIKNCIIYTGSKALTSYAIFAGSATTIGTAGDDNDNLTIQNNNIYFAYYGIYAAATSISGANDNLTITNNNIGNSTLASSIGITAIYMAQVAGASVSGNDIFNITVTSGAVDAVNLNSVTGSSFFNNKVHDITNQNTTIAAGRAAAITITTGSAASADKFYNNFIYSIINTSRSSSAVNGCHGFSIQQGGGYSLYYNTVNLSGDRDALVSGASTDPVVGNISTAFYIAASITTLDIRDNIFVNSQTAAALLPPSFAIYSASANTAFSAIDYNDYSVSGAQGVLGFLTSNRTDLAGIIAGFGGNANSINVSPVFTSSTDLHLNVTANGGLDNLATPIAGITTDIDAATRNTASPDMGADEFSSCGSTLFTWVGGTSTDWNLPANWCGGALLPTSTVDVLIPGGLVRYPSIFQTADASVKSITIANGASLSVLGAYNITVAAGGSFTTNGTGAFTSTSTGAVIFAGAGTVAGSATTAFKNITINGNLTLTKAPTISGDFTINNTATVSTTSPTYGASSKLIYNVTGSYTTGTEWNAGGATTFTTPGAGVPKDVTIQNTAFVTLPNIVLAAAGTLTIGSGTTLTLAAGTNILYVGGNWVNSGGTFTDGSRTVTLNNGTSQSVSGTTAFYNLSILNSSTVSFGTSTVTVANTFSNNGSNMNPQTSTFIFTGTSGSLIGTAAHNFYNLQINNLAVITHNSGGGLIHVDNDFKNNGTFTELSTYTFYFDKPNTSPTITGIGTTTFGNLGIGLTNLSNPTNLNTGSSNFTIGGLALTFNSNASSLTSTTGAVTFATANTGFCTISNAALITGTSISFYDVNITPVSVFGGVDFGNGISTINRNLTINTLGYVTGNAPKYVSTSTLIYNSTSNPYNVGIEWTGNATSPGFGIPQNVTISNTNNVTMPAGNRGMAGNLNINAGTLTLNGTSGNDLYIAGNWNRGASGAFVPNNRAVFFNGNGGLVDQTITVTSGTATFAYLIINKTDNKNVVLNGTDVVVNGGLGSNSFELLNGGLDLNQRTFTYNTFNTFLNAFTIDGTAGNLTRNIISTGGAGTFAFTHADNTATRVAVISRKTGFASLLSFASNVVVTISGTGTQNSGVDFGASLSTINGTLQINAKGYVSTNPPTYATNSLLKYNIGASYLRFNEWNNTSGNPGYPFNVQMSLSGTSFVPAGTANAYAATTLNMGGTLTIDAGCFFDMSNGNANNMTVPLNVLGDILINGTLRTSQSAGGDIGIKGNWTNNGTFTPYSRKVTFDGTGTQSIAGTQTTGFYDLTVSNTVNPVIQGATVSVSNILALNNILSLNGNILNLNGTITGSGTLTGSNTSTLNLGGTGNSMGTLNFTSGSQLLNTISISRTGGTSADPSRVILGSSLAANNITLTNGIIVTGTNNLFTFNNSGGTLTPPATYTNSFIATCDASGTPLAVPGPMGSPFTGTYGFRIKTVGNTNTFFPVGPTYLPAGSGLTPSPNRMMINNALATPDFTVVVNKGDLSGTGGAIVNRIWYVKSSSDTGQATMQLYFTQRDPTGWLSAQDEVESGFQYTEILLLQRDYTTDPNFISISNVGADKRSITYSALTETYAQYTIGLSTDNLGRAIGLSEFNRFGIANKANIILPVTITNLRAALQNTSVALSWTSVSETNIDHYEIERSINGISFKSIGSKAALNNGSIKTDYAFLDIHPQSGDNYYRIKVVEKDGRISYTNVVLITTTGGSIQITIQPNPVKNGNALVRFVNAPEGKYNLILYSNSGQKVWQSNVGHLGGSADYSIKLPVSIAKGIYFMHVENEGIEVVKKLMVE